MAKTTVEEDVKQFLDYFKDVDSFAQKFQDAKLPTAEILKDIPRIVRVMLMSAFINEGFFGIIAAKVSEEDVEKVRSIVQKLERFAAKIVRHSRVVLAKEDEKVEEKKAHGEITDISVTPFYDYDAKQNKIRLMFFCDSDKLMDSTVSFGAYLSLSSSLLTELDGCLKTVAEFDPKLLPTKDNLKAYKKRLERVSASAQRIASQLKIELEPPKPEEKTEKIS